MKKSKKKDIQYLLNTGAPEGEHVAFINDAEASLLKYAGGSGRTDNNPYGIPSYAEDDEDQDASGGGEASTSGEDTGSNESSYGGDDGGQSYTQEFDNYANLINAYNAAAPDNPAFTERQMAIPTLTRLVTENAQKRREQKELNDLLALQRNRNSPKAAYFDHLVGNAPKWSGNPTGLTTRQIVENDNRNTLNGSFGNQYHEYNPQGLFGRPDGEDGDDGFSGGDPTKYYEGYEDFPGSAANYYDADALRSTFDETNDLGSWLSSKFGFHDEQVYDEKNGWTVSENNFRGDDMPAVDIGLSLLGAGPAVAAKNIAYAVAKDKPFDAALGTASIFGVPGAKSLSTANDVLGLIDANPDNLINKTNPADFFGKQIKSIPTRIGDTVDDASERVSDFFGNDYEFSQGGDFSGVFGDDGPSQNPYRQQQYFPAPQQTAQADTPSTPSLVPSPFDYYGKQYVKQQQQWDGNNFTPAPFVRRIV